MALITAAGLAGAAAGAGIAWGTTKVLNAISNWWRGGGKKGRARGGKPTTTQAGGIKSTTLPGGDAIYEIEKHNPGFTKALIANREEVMKRLMAEPDKWPGAKEFIGQAKEVFGDLPEFEKLAPYQRTEIPELPPESELKPFDIKPIAAQAMQRFRGEVVPGLAERFTALTGGGQRSGAFARQTTRAGERLTGALAELQAREERADALERAKLGMQRSQLGLQRAGLQQQQEAEAWRSALARRGQEADIGFGRRRQQLNEAGLMADIYGKGRHAGESWLDRQIKLLYGDIPSPYHIATQPAPERMPGWREALLPSLAKTGGKLAATYGQEYIKNMFA